MGGKRERERVCTFRGKSRMSKIGLGNEKRKKEPTNVNSELERERQRPRDIQR